VETIEDYSCWNAKLLETIQQLLETAQLLKTFQLL
jgi:hypothetical protein